MWREWDKEKGKHVEKCCREETWKGSDEFCIFHDPSPDKNVNLFKKAIEKQMQSETGKYDFVGYCFPDEWRFCGEKFEDDADFRETVFQNVEFERAIFKDVKFSRATFKGDADFKETVFQGDAYFVEVAFQDADFEKAIFQDADFEKAIFKKSANFRGVTFQRSASFYAATFRESAHFEGITSERNANFGRALFGSHAYFHRSTFQNAYFGEASFQDVDFLGAEFSDVDFNRALFQNAYFYGASFKNAYFHESTFKQMADFRETVVKENLEFFSYDIGKFNLQNAKIFSRGIISADLTNAKFHRAYLEKISFPDSIWPQSFVIIEELNMKEEGLSLREIETIYRNLKRNMQLQGDYSQASAFHFREMEMKRRRSKGSNRLYLEFYHFLAGYGESLSRTIFSSCYVILWYAFLYWKCECLQYSMESLTPFQQLAQDLYSSFLVFSVVGLGSIHPLNSLGRILICTEAVVGALLIVFLVTTYARRLIRLGW